MQARDHRVPGPLAFFKINGIVLNRRTAVVYPTINGRCLMKTFLLMLIFIGISSTAALAQEASQLPGHRNLQCYGTEAVKAAVQMRGQPDVVIWLRKNSASVRKIVANACTQMRLYGYIHDKEVLGRFNATNPPVIVWIFADNHRVLPIQVVAALLLEHSPSNDAHR